MAGQVPGSSRRPLITVLVPAFNAGPYVAEALRSVQRQGIESLELLVVDDGSTDETPVVLAGITDPRLRVVRQDNTGLVGALNRGIDEARGRFLARLDADDVMPVGRLQAQLSAMTADSRLLVLGTGYETFGEVSFRVRMPRTDRACRERLSFGSCHCGASVMIRRDRLIASGVRFDPADLYAEDYGMWCQLSDYGRLGNLPLVGYRYRIHGGQVSARHVDVQRGTHLRIARAYAESRGRRAIAEADLRTLLWPTQPARRGPWSALRRSAALVGPAVRAAGVNPGAESLRFLSRKLFEAAAGAW